MIGRRTTTGKVPKLQCHAGKTELVSGTGHIVTIVTLSCRSVKPPPGDAVKEANQRIEESLGGGSYGITID